VRSNGSIDIGMFFTGAVLVFPAIYVLQFYYSGEWIVSFAIRKLIDFLFHYVAVQTDSLYSCMENTKSNKGAYLLS
jgi:hypothetical protein